MKKALLFIAVTLTLPIIGFSQNDGCIFLGKVLSDTASFSKVPVERNCPLKLPSIFESENLLEIRFNATFPWNDPDSYPLNVYVVVSFNKKWEVKNYFYEYYNDTLRFSQQHWRRSGSHGVKLKDMKRQFVCEDVTDKINTDSLVNHLGLLGLFAISKEDNEHQYWLYTENNTVSDEWSVIDAGFYAIEYKVGDKLRKFACYIGSSIKIEEIGNIFFKVFMINSYKKVKRLGD